MTNNKKGHRYLQIADEFKSKIQDGTYQIGDQLPTEKEICDKFEVSRYTARSALKHLIDLQLIERRQGSGSVVVATESPLIHKSFMQDIDDLWQYGNTTRFNIYSQESLENCDYLNQFDSGNYVLLKGNRFMDTDSESPFCITEVYLWTDDESLNKDLIEGNNPVDALMSYLCPKNLQRVEQVVSARNMTELESEVLGCAPQEAALCAERKYFDNQNRHVATALNVHSGEHYEYATVLHRKND